VYSCGLAKQGTAAFLRLHAEESIFLGAEWYLALEDFKNNRPVVGFTVKQMVISRIASSGLKFGEMTLFLRHPSWHSRGVLQR